jgi:hypothetical protein
MSRNNDVRQLLQFELNFLTDGGYGRSPHAPWRAPLVFEDSPTCLNFNTQGCSRPCGECPLMQFVPEEKQGQAAPCRFIPLTAMGETVDDFYRSGTPLEMEEALKSWLQEQLRQSEDFPIS